MYMYIRTGCCWGGGGGKIPESIHHLGKIGGFTEEHSQIAATRVPRSTYARIRGEEDEDEEGRRVNCCPMAHRAEY